MPRPESWPTISGGSSTTGRSWPGDRRCRAAGAVVATTPADVGDRGGDPGRGDPRRGRRHGPPLGRAAADTLGLARGAGGPIARATGAPLQLPRRGRDRRPGPGPNRVARRRAGPAELRRDQVFCRKALGYYEAIAGRYRDDSEMQVIVAAADHRIGFIRMILQEPHAEDAYRRSIALYRGLLAGSPGSRDLRMALALTYGDLLLLLRKTGSPASRKDCLERLVALREGLVADFPDERDYLICLTYFRAELATLLESLGRPARPDRSASGSGTTSSRWCTAIPATPSCPTTWPGCWSPVPPTVNARRRRTGVGIAREAVTLAPKAGNYWNTLGVAQYRAGDAKAAVAALEESMRLRAGGDPYDWLFLAMAPISSAIARVHGPGTTGLSPGSPHDRHPAKNSADSVTRPHESSIRGIHRPELTRFPSNNPDIASSRI